MEAYGITDICQFSLLCTSVSFHSFSSCHYRQAATPPPRNTSHPKADAGSSRAVDQRPPEDAGRAPKGSILSSHPPRFQLHPTSPISTAAPRYERIHSVPQSTAMLTAAAELPLGPHTPTAGNHRLSRTLPATPPHRPAPCFAHTPKARSANKGRGAGVGPSRAALCRAHSALPPALRRPLRRGGRPAFPSHREPTGRGRGAHSACPRGRSWWRRGDGGEGERAERQEQGDNGHVFRKHAAPFASPPAERTAPIGGPAPN